MSAAVRTNDSSEVLGEKRQLATDRATLPSAPARWACEVWSEKTLAHLLRLEKERRGLPSDSRCFIGMSDLAYGNTRTDERGYFSAFLSDRTRCASRLGLVSRRPRLLADWLPIAAKVSFEERHRLFIEEEQELRPRSLIYLIDRSGREHPFEGKIIADYLAGRIEVVGAVFASMPYKPTKVSERKNRALSEAGVIPAKLTASERGRLDQDLLAERYPTFRWHFDWRKYVVVGVPDGITASFVYEFKSTKELDRMKLMATRQADLYGYFFAREHKRIQIRDVPGGSVLTFSSPIDRLNAETTLERYAALLKPS